MNELSPEPRVRPTTQAAEGVSRLRWLTELGIFTEDDRIELIANLVPLMVGPVAVRLADQRIE
jgi:hypothetical protein